MNREILQGDVFDRIKDIESDSIDCVITSPPYWSLRDYGAKGQIGLETSYKDFIQTMHNLMEELKRVLKNTGSCFVNIGDTYSGFRAESKWTATSMHGNFQSRAMREGKFSGQVKNEVQAKSLVGIPERLFINAIDSGWVARNHLIWHKPNAMPGSKTDAFTSKYEPVFFFTKTSEPQYYVHTVSLQARDRLPSKPQLGVDYEMIPCYNRSTDKAARIPCKDTGCSLCRGTGEKKRTFWKSINYYFDLNAVREPVTYAESARKEPYNDGLQQDSLTNYGVKEKAIREKYKAAPNSNVARLHRDRKGNPNKQDNTPGPDGKPKANYKGFNDRWNESRKGSAANNKQLSNRNFLPVQNPREHENPHGKNPGDVWSINTQGFADAHFATFPVKLPLRILKAACAKQVCKKCAKPRIPISKATGEYGGILGQSWHNHENDQEAGQSQAKTLRRIEAEFEIVGNSDCGCNAGFRPGLVLDPFFGAGTTGVAAEELGLHWVGIELKEEYIQTARKRLDKYRADKELLAQ